MAQTGIAIVDLDGHPIECNPALLALLGYTADELRGMRFTEFTHPDDRGREFPLYEQLKAGEIDGYRLDKRYMRKDGQIVWVYLSCTLLRDPDGRPTYALGMVDDITERNRVVDALRQANARFRAILDSARARIVLVDLEGHPFQVNPAAEKLLGYTADEQMRMDFTQFTHPEDIATEAPLFRKLAAGEIDSYEMDKRYIRKDGQVMWGHLTCTLVRESDGKPAYALGMAQDITERKQAEQALRESEALYRSLVNVLPEGVAVSDMAGHITFASPQTVSIYGLTSTADAIGTRVLQWIAPESHEKAVRNMAGLARNERSTDNEYVLVRKDGSRFFGQIVGALLTDGEGKPKGMVTVHRDITARKQAEEALRASEARQRALLAAIPDLMLVNRMDGTFTDFHVPPGAPMLVDPAALIGKRLEDVLPAATPSERTLEQIKSGEPAPFEFALDFGDERRHFESRTVPCSSDEVLTLIRDVTQRKRAQEDLQRHAHGMEVLYRNSLEIYAENELPTLLRSMAERATEVAGGTTGAVLLVKPGGEALQVVASHNTVADHLGETIPLDQGLAGQVARSGELLAIEDYEAWPDRLRLAGAPTIGRAIAVPLKAGDETLGVVQVMDREHAGRFDETAVRLLRLLADQAALAIRGARLRESLERELAERRRAEEEMERIQAQLLAGPEDGGGRPAGRRRRPRLQQPADRHHRLRRARR